MACFRGTKDFSIYGSANPLSGWTKLMNSTLVHGGHTRNCGLPLEEFDFYSAQNYRFIKFEANTYVGSGTALNYIGFEL